MDSDADTDTQPHPHALYLTDAEPDVHPDTNPDDVPDESSDPDGYGHTDLCNQYAVPYADGYGHHRV